MWLSAQVKACNDGKHIGIHSEIDRSDAPTNSYEEELV